LVDAIGKQLSQPPGLKGGLYARIRSTLTELEARKLMSTLGKGVKEAM
jgi:hypothetical protein